MASNATASNSGLLFRPVETKRASEAIYDQIKQLIIDGEYKPGDRLPSERSLMDMLQRSRPTIREALRMLERAGFVRIVPGTNGAIVQEFSLRNVEQPLEVMLKTSKVSLDELAEYRVHNDTLTARLAALRRTDADITVLKDLLNQAQKCIEIKDFDGFIQMDEKFHSSLAITGKNQVSRIMTKALGHLVRPFLFNDFSTISTEAKISKCDRILSMHWGILNAVITQDPALAEDLMAAHIHAFLTEIPAMEK